MNQTGNETNSTFLLNTFHYEPSLAASIIATSAFGLALVLCFALTIYWTRWKSLYMHIVTFTAGLECLGYVTRIIAQTQMDLAAFIISTVLILACPIALACVNYYVMSIILKEVGRSIYCLKAQYVYRLFLCSDILTFLLQIVGGGLLAATANSDDPDTANILNNAGKALTLVSLSIQLVFFSCFTWITIRAAFGRKWKLFSLPSLRFVFIGLWLTLLFLFIRNIFRLAEYASGETGYLQTNEWPFYIFEFLPLFLCIVTYIIFHFGRLLPEDGIWKQEIKDHKYSKQPKVKEELKI
jgi:hypothetical protein